MDDMLFSPSLIGKKIERIRRWKGISQESLAHKLGISRQRLSQIEQSSEIDPEKLSSIADALGVPVEAIENYNEDSVVINIQNMNDHSGVYNYTINPYDKIMELVEEIRKLYQQVIQVEREKNEILQRLLDTK